MTTEQKVTIIEAAQFYLAEKQIPQRTLSINSGVNESYLSVMLAGGLVAKAGDKDVEISDKYFHMLAQAIGYSTKKEYWGFVETKEFVKIVDALQDAKKDGANGMIICETGSGKTYAVDRFLTAHPDGTIKLTVNNLTMIHDLIRMIMEKLKLPVTGSNAMRLANIIIALRELKRRGGTPLLLIDEAENMSLKMLQMIKGLYDGVKDYAAIMLVGTPKLIVMLDKLERKDADGIPQFRRRFKAGTRFINPGMNRFAPFYKKFGIEDKGLIRLLDSICGNYGELNNYLERAMREADIAGTTLTEEFFRLVWDMPK